MTGVGRFRAASPPTPEFRYGATGKKQSGVKSAFGGQAALFFLRTENFFENLPTVAVDLRRPEKFCYI